MGNYWSTPPDLSETIRTAHSGKANAGREYNKQCNELWETLCQEKPIQLTEVTQEQIDEKSGPQKVRIVCISDTHNTQEKAAFPEIPDGDILIHAGDFTYLGKLQRVRDFNAWLGRLPHRHKIVIAGNHELSFDPKTRGRDHVHMSGRVSEVDHGQLVDIRKEITNAIYLEDSAVELCGLKFYGSPYSLEFGNWAFMYKRNDPEAANAIWNKIPDDTDVLITHGPPFGIGDLCHHGDWAGCPELLKTVTRRVKPKLHVFGHIHEARGMWTDGTTTFINPSVCTIKMKGGQLNRPFVVDLDCENAPTQEQ